MESLPSIWCLKLLTEPSSHLITLKSQNFPVKNSNLKFRMALLPNTQSSKLSNFWCLLSSHLRLWVSLGLLSSHRLIFILPVTPITFPHMRYIIVTSHELWLILSLQQGGDIHKNLGCIIGARRDWISARKTGLAKTALVMEFPYYGDVLQYKLMKF